MVRRETEKPMDAEIQALKRAVAEKQPGADARLVAAYVRTGFEGFAPIPGRIREQGRFIEDERLSPFVADDGPNPDTIKADYIKVEVSYSKGGFNNWHHTQDPRGYSLHVSIEGREFNASGVLRGTSYTLFGSGYKSLLLEAKRFSAKTLAAVQVPAEKLADLKARVRKLYADEQAKKAASAALFAEQAAARTTAVILNAPVAP
jgi:hypothetical protein